MILGKKYSYPKAIKTFLRAAILLDISIQIIYQSPSFDPENIEDRKLQKIILRTRKIYL